VSRRRGPAGKPELDPDFPRGPPQTYAPPLFQQGKARRVARKIKQFTDGSSNGQHLFRHSGGKGMLPRLGAGFSQAFLKRFFTFPKIPAAPFSDDAHHHKKRDKHKSACQEHIQHAAPALFIV
jgi:hypothetical protein